MAGRLEKLFTRYRDRGDAGALAEVFDATSPELFRLAQHLVRDPLAAEDVLQETFVSAIDAAPRWDDQRPLVPWLTGILARKASESRRRARREVDPARLDERGERDPAHAAVDAEFSAALREALGRLPQLYREVLERHLLDGAKPAEIARDLERSPGAVRMQLFRGLEQLRRALPAGFAAGAALAALAPRGMAAVREAVVAHAAAQGAAIAAAAGGATLASGALASTLGLAAALLVAVGVVLGGGWWVARGLPRTVPDGVDPTVPAPRVVEADPDGAAGAVVPVRETAASAPVAPLRVLRGRVTGPEGAARAEVELALRGVARYDWPEAWTLTAELDADGGFALPLDGLLAQARARGAVDALELEVDHPDWLPQRVRVEADAARAAAADARELELWVEVDLRPALVLEGRVERAAPGAAPEVGALRVVDGAVEPHWLDRTTADAEGRFRLRLAEVGEVEVVACAADTLADRERLWVGVGGAALPRALRLESGVHLTGRFEAPQLAGAIASARLAPVLEEIAGDAVELAGRTLFLLSSGWSVAALVVAVDDEGRFEAAGLPRGALRVAPRARAGLVLHPPQSFERECLLAQPLEQRTFELETARLDVRIVDEEARPVTAALQVSVGGWFSAATVQVGGLCELALPANSEPQLMVAGGVGGVRTLPALARGERREVTLELAATPPAGTLVLRLQAPDDAPTSISVALRHPGETEPFEVRTLERSGRTLELVDPPREAFELELFVGGAHRHLEDGWLPAALALPAAGERRAQQTLTLERGARLRLVANDAAGRSQPLAVRLVDLWGVEHEVRFLRRGSFAQGFTEDGRLSPLGAVDVVPNLAPGLWTVEYVDADGAAQRRHVRLLEGEERLLELEP